MFNNINNNNGFSYGNSQLNNASNVINLASIRANLQKSGYASSPYVDSSEISSNAMQLFQKDMDIKTHKYPVFWSIIIRKINHILKECKSFSPKVL